MNQNLFLWEYGNYLIKSHKLTGIYRICYELIRASSDMLF